jgi:hypothetical protein
LKKTKRVAIIFFVILFVDMIFMISGCGNNVIECNSPSENEFKEKWNSELEASNECQTDDQCTVINTECPLGCFAYVNIEHKDRLVKLAKDLKNNFSRCGTDCSYSCIPPDRPVCMNNVCIGISSGE